MHDWSRADLRIGVIVGRLRFMRARGFGSFLSFGLARFTCTLA
ncbi:hypothetical protein BN2497_10491 [Janthinobacterium sp. CG23_2]|nr:hypothetical protein BN2497_47 [Janthinobacterium sp. CG23_2]CUI03897.1 hypothetical protein BN2497_2571 [Janthinobacterium sp. CG23_2]CUI07857.1 hypothetical protein BN2497_10491 [Janthinobacterium sp. CG23_2]CUU26421.1 hypothetical protein BN3177_47 [Janthinobacterium sp. CG23_2]CUU27683.1 hypothetical protein BN3177_2571 [Janthinobacterium sp. CG23_2]